MRRRKMTGYGSLGATVLATIFLPMVLGCAGPRGLASDAARDRGFAPAPDTARSYSREEPFTARPFRPWMGRRWIGDAVAYGPHRDGQRPGGPSPTPQQLREDLGLMLRHWRMMRLYGAEGPAESILELIRRDRLDMKVLLGIWVQPEDRRDSTGRVIERFPEAAAANRREIEAGVRLVAAYPGIVRAVSVGNETQVFWSAHRVPAQRLIEIVREVRARTRVPVTVADDYNFWNKPESEVVAREVDFITTHAHPLWNGRTVGDALAWTERTLAQVQALHPGRLLVLGETGWATQRTDEGDQGKLMKGEASEAQQAEFFRALNAWVERTRIPTFFFEAFDENWKGGASPGDAEKHWGLFRADRSPKQAAREVR